MDYRWLAGVSMEAISCSTATISEEVIRSAYFCSMSKRFASWGPRARSPTQSVATTVLKLQLMESITAARTQPEVVHPVTITVSTLLPTYHAARLVPKNAEGWVLRTMYSPSQG